MPGHKITASHLRKALRKCQSAQEVPRTADVAIVGGPQDRRTPRSVLLLAVLAVSCFGATYALVKFSQQVKKPETGSPAGMRGVPGGEFTMGTDSDLGWPDENPAHRVRVDGF